MSNIMDCGVCMEECKENLTCGACNTTYCIDCSKQFLLSTPSAQCMGCKKEWDERFIRDNFPKQWVNGEYKKRIQELIFQRELSYIPDTMSLVEEVNNYNKQNFLFYERLEQEAFYDEKIYKLRKEQAKLSVGTEQHTDRLKVIAKEISTLTKQKDSIITRGKTRPSAIDFETTEEEKQRNRRLREERLNHRIGGYQEEQKEEKQEFVGLKCSLDKCRGYLNEKNICSVCEKELCKNCNQEKIENHICNKDDIETFKMLLKETKACPGCGVRTSKVDGCDQMWCIECKTAWNWSTCKKVAGAIHNPEYFRYMRERGIAIPTNPEERRADNAIRTGCLDQPHFDTLIHNSCIKVGRNYGDISFSQKYKIRDKYQVNNLCIFLQNLFRHIYNVRNQQTGGAIWRNHNKNTKNENAGGIVKRKVFNFETCKKARVDYILHNTTEENFKKYIIREHREIEYENMIQSLCYTFSYVIEDFLRLFQQFLEPNAHLRSLDLKDIPEDIFDGLINYIEYFNKECEKIAEMFGYKTHFKAEIEGDVIKINKTKMKRGVSKKVNKKIEMEEDEELDSLEVERDRDNGRRKPIIFDSDSDSE